LSQNNIKIYIKTALTYFGAVTLSSGSALFVLAELTLVKIANYGTSVCNEFGGDVAAYISRSLLACVRCTLRNLLIYAATSPPN